MIGNTDRQITFSDCWLEGKIPDNSYWSKMRKWADRNGTILQSWTGGPYTDVWSNWFEGPEVFLGLVTDGSVNNYYGFKVDSMECIIDEIYGNPKYYFTK